MAARDFLLEIGTEEMPGFGLPGRHRPAARPGGGPVRGRRHRPRAGRRRRDGRTATHRCPGAGRARAADPARDRPAGPCRRGRVRRRGQADHGRRGLRPGEGRGAGRPAGARGERPPVRVLRVAQREPARRPSCCPRSASRLVRDMYFPKNMRWGARDLRFSRPLRWLVALFGDDLVPFEMAGVVERSDQPRPPGAGRTGRGRLGRATMSRRSATLG